MSMLMMRKSVAATRRAGRPSGLSVANVRLLSLPYFFLKLLKTDISENFQIVLWNAPSPRADLASLGSALTDFAEMLLERDQPETKGCNISPTANAAPIHAMTPSIS